jgi:glycosyltransferase involved in cell wall biosynthesis
VKILLLNQTFYPDASATSYYLTDLARGLKREGHDVSVITSMRAYDEPGRRFPSHEEIDGIRIQRVDHWSLGKENRFLRMLGFASFGSGLLVRLAMTGRHDVVVALTTPPLLAVLALLFCGVKGGRFVYWVMDLNPDEAIAAGWLKRGAMPARMLHGLSKWSLRRSSAVVALDRFMRRRIEADYGVPPSRVTVLPPWSFDAEMRPAPAEKNRFRTRDGSGANFTVMYAGNHSVCHPLDTLLEACLRSRGEPSLVYCFAGWGTRTRDVASFKEKHGLRNILQLPYVPRDELGELLSSADLHVVVMGEPYVGIVHPSKIYGILAVGKPFVFIGPEESHMGDLMRESGLGWHVNHGDVDRLLSVIAEARGLTEARREEIRRKSLDEARKRFSGRKLVPELVRLVEKVAAEGLR